MIDPPARNSPPDSFRTHPEEGDKDRPDLDLIFKAGTKARDLGGSVHDNPYAVGSEERDEWTAGYNASPDLDESDDSGASR